MARRDAGARAIAYRPAEDGGAHGLKGNAGARMRRFRSPRRPDGASVD